LGRVNEQLWAFIEDLFASSELNRLPMAYGGGRIFAQPLVGISLGDDDIFQTYKQVVGPEHLTPAEMWGRSGFLKDEGLATRLRVVSIVFPYTDQIRDAGEASGDRELPPEIYCVARNLANPFMRSVQEETAWFLREQGYRALSGTHSQLYQVLTEREPFRIYSTWSERHVAFAAGLGTFSLHEGLITEVGCNVRLASVITDAPLERTPRRSDEPYANCLYLTRGTCGECVRRCPAGAITEQGHDKEKCSRHGRKVRDEMGKRPLKAALRPSYLVVNGETRTRYPVGCALCQFGVPCMDKNPMAQRGQNLDMGAM
jgi:epoxyqueuosine reductase